MRRARRVDANQPTIVDALRRAGCSVEVLSDIGRGLPDLIVGRAGREYWLELKTGKEPLTLTESRWHNEWRGSRPAVIRTTAEALSAVGLTPKSRPQPKVSVCPECGEWPKDCDCAEKQEQKKREEVKRALEAK